ncbi:DUF6415 family natural product biosynthesis protein [Streptomyces sp. NBC_01485]|uniref:DUF6415 family natural product biosynthesis protein n=1 Tax=Streptomyces sp. NBC_01485 TaxID=2903884 RepID=UPI002E36DA8D|nr:DUF6415 family natural product biosynthesis protein [Streptomyces sp. NBC_01485]
MANSTTRAPAAAERGPADPPDIAVMRETVGILLDDDAVALAPVGDELGKLTRVVRGYLELLIPIVERAAERLERESVNRYCVLACVGEARGKLRTGPGQRADGAITHARRLARVLNALCDHYDKIGGGRP